VHERELLLQIIDTVPHWYLADRGPFTYSLEVGDCELAFMSHGVLTPELLSLYVGLLRSLAL
jgi:hypothetical protein